MKKHFLSITLLTLCVVIAASCVKDRSITSSTVVPPPVNTGSDTLIYYWNFNTDTLHYLIPNVALVTGSSLTYSGAYSDTAQPGTTLNAVGVDTVLNLVDGSLRLRNPAGTGTFVMSLPTTGYKNIVLKYAVERTSKGSQQNSIAYTTDGSTWITTAISAYDSYTIDSTSTTNGFQLETLDFSSDSAVNNNANFAVQVSFSNGNTNTSGNDRYDNITLYGIKK